MLCPLIQIYVYVCFFFPINVTSESSVDAKIKNHTVHKSHLEKYFTERGSVHVFTAHPDAIVFLIHEV